MKFHPIEAFRNPVTRPRAIIWVGALLCFVCLFVAIAVGATTSFWFCAEICHSVQADSINSYLNSSHKNVSCVACHYKPGKSPLSLIESKLGAAIAELPPTLMGTFSIPINPYSALALNKYEFPDNRCTQCHNLNNRNVTPSPGIVIDHKVHEDFGVTCTMCHNRVGHNEYGIDLVLSDPQTGEPAFMHEDFMLMTACYRCHDMETNKPATGECLACHTPDFNLVPSNHDVADFLGRPHADMALDAYSLVQETIEKHDIVEPNEKTKTAQLRAITDDVDGSAAKKAGYDAPLPLAPVAAINYCYTCHLQSFCFDCHGMDMPHPQQFLTPVSITDVDGHPAMSKEEEKAEKCVMCHGVETETQFCTACHHGPESDWNFDMNSDWTMVQHAVAIDTTGVGICTQACHTTQFCVDCHLSMNIIPVSHEVANFTYPEVPAMTIYGVEPAKATAAHALSARTSTEGCAVCHGEGGFNAQFCLDCHGMDMPHPDQFRRMHSASDPATCLTCHGYVEVCSSCHHIGATATSNWMQLHGVATIEHGSSTCAGICHLQQDCVDCHQADNVVPASHFASDFVQGGGHVTQFRADVDNCLFCHEGQASTLANSPYCKGCHVLDMPHPTGGGAEVFPHSKEINDGTYDRPTCAICHTQVFCDACHHPESIATEPWYTYHAVVATEGNAMDCYRCHQETFCAFCHVRVARERSGR